MDNIKARRQVCDIERRERQERKTRGVLAFALVMVDHVGVLRTGKVVFTQHGRRVIVTASFPTPHNRARTSWTGEAPWMNAALAGATFHVRDGEVRRLSDSRSAIDWRHQLEIAGITVIPIL